MTDRDDRDKRGGSRGRPPSRTSGPGRPRSGDGKPRAFGDRPPRRDNADGDRPFAKRPYGENKSRAFGDKPPRGERPFGDRAPRGDKPFGDRPPRRDRPDGDRPFAKRAFGDKPPRGELPFGERPPRGSKPFGDKPFGDRPPRRERPDGERPARRKDFGGPDGFARGSGGSGDRGDDRPRRSSRLEPQSPNRDVTPLPVAATGGEPERIAKVMARAGIASRRDCEAIILEGRVSVNGQVLDSPALDVTLDDVILIDGEPLPERERTRLWLYHKPRGLVTTEHDPEGRPTLFEHLPDELPRVVSVGRLDINTEGLMLLTNDGGLARVLAHPATGWLRRYRVRAYGDVTQADLDTVRDGLVLDGEEFGPVIATFERQRGDNTWLTVDLREGRNREVKRVLEHLGLAVNRLIRISFGPFQLGDLEEGEVMEVKSRVLADQLGPELAAQAGADFAGPRREGVRVLRPGEIPEFEEREAPKRRSRLEPARFVWRDEDSEDKAAKSRKGGPRRGADPREDRAARSEKSDVRRERREPVTDPAGRRVKVERVTALSDDRAPLRRPTRREMEAGQAADGDRPIRKPRFARSQQDEAPAPERPAFRQRPDRGEDRPFRSRDGDRERAPFKPRAPRPDRPPREEGERAAPRWRDRVEGRERPRQDRGDGPREDRPFRGKPRGSFGGKPFGDRPFGDRREGDGGDRPFREPRPPRQDGERPARPPRSGGFGGKPGGSREGRPGGGFGGKPGGRPGGGFGGKPGGRPGGRPGGGSRPPSGGPRGPRSKG